MGLGGGVYDVEKSTFWVDMRGGCKDFLRRNAFCILRMKTSKKVGLALTSNRPAY